MKTFVHIVFGIFIGGMIFAATTPKSYLDTDKMYLHADQEVIVSQVRISRGVWEYQLEGLDVLTILKSSTPLDVQKGDTLKMFPKKNPRCVAYKWKNKIIWKNEE